jgi:scyllo-inositol 2-dehydrogenase (NADP+)
MAKEAFRLHKKPVGWAVLGLGMGQYHANLIQKASGLKLVALCDANPAAIARCEGKFPGVARYSSISQLLADPKVEGISVVLPHNLHAPVAIRLLKAGRHVVLDKPFALTVAEGKRMIAAARKNRRMISCFHNRRWDVDYRTVQNLVDKGTIGKVRYIESRIGGAGRIPPGPWRANRKQMGGLLYDWGAHLVDQSMRLIKCRPVSVYGFAQRDVPTKKGWDIEDRMQALVRFEDGSVALLAWVFNSPAPLPRMIVEGENGGVRVEHLLQDAPKDNPDGVKLYQLGKDRKTVQKSLPYAKVHWSGYYINVGRALMGKERLLVRPEEAIRHVAICEAAYKSARSGQVVKLPKALF